MPCIKIIDGIKLYIYAAVHHPPHFHAIYAEYEELIIIETLETYIGELPKIHRKKVVSWASNNKEFIFKQWKKFNK